MKKTVLCLLIVAFAVIVNGQTSEKKWGIGAGAGAYGTLERGGIGIIPDLYLGRYLSPRFDMMLRGNLGLFNSIVKNDLDMGSAFLNLRYKFNDETKKLRPYLYAGPGYLGDNNEKGLSFDAGLGLKYYFRPNLAIYFEGGYINGIDATVNNTTIKDNLWRSNAGLEIDFGKSIF